MTIATIRNFIRLIAPEFADIGLRLEAHPGSQVGGLYIPGSISESAKPTIIVNIGHRPSEDAILEVITHEVAHAATDNAPSLFAPITAEDINLRREVARRAMDGVLPEPKMPYDRHEADFIRCLIHLWVRSDALGYLFTAQSLFPHGHYQLSDLFTYHNALGDEPTRMAQLSLREILQIEPPDDFSELWREDVAAAELEKEEQNMSIFDTLKKRRESRAASFHELARDIADGKSVKPELAERILTDCEKTAEELENMVATYAERKRKREVVSRADGELTKELAQIETKLAACREKLERAQHEYAETSYPLRQRAQAIESVMSAADSARGQLANMNTHPDETIRDRCRQAQVRRDELQGHVLKLQKMLSHNIKTRAALQAKIEHESAHTIRMRPAADPYGVDADALRQSRMQDEANTCAKEIEAQTEALKQAEKELAQADRDLERATAQLVAN